MKVIPTAGNILIKGEEIKSVTEGGIHLPDSAQRQQQPSFAIVVAVNPQGNRRAEQTSPTELQVVENFKVGAKVIVNAYAGHPVDLGGVPHRIIKAEEVLAIVKEG